MYSNEAKAYVRLAQHAFAKIFAWTNMPTWWKGVGSLTLEIELHWVMSNPASARPD